MFIVAEELEIKPPKLYFVNDQGEYVPEYIPPILFKHAYWLREKYIAARTYFGKDIYYWHLRHRASPDFRKVLDIEFIQHVALEHNYQPQDPVERRHYNRVWKLYGHEMKLVLQEIGRDKDTKWKDPKFRKGHPYAYAYSDKWFLKFPVVERKLLYHGISLDQLDPLIELLNDRASERIDGYCEKHGLNPDTGEKLATKTIKNNKNRTKTKKNETSPSSH